MQVEVTTSWSCSPWPRSEDSAHRTPPVRQPDMESEATHAHIVYGGGRVGLLLNLECCASHEKIESSASRASLELAEHTWYITVQQRRPRSKKSPMSLSLSLSLLSPLEWRRNDDQSSPNYSPPMGCHQPPLNPLGGISQSSYHVVRYDCSS